MRQTYRKQSILLAAALLTFPAASQANQPTAVSGPVQSVEKTTTVNVRENVVVVSGRMSLGLINGEANEIVYDAGSGRKLSQLTWQLENVAMAGFGLSVTPTHWLKLNGDIWINVNEGSGYMDDYDWFVPGLDWTDWSHHDDTDVDELTMYDINAEFTVFRQSQARFFGILGYKQDLFEWTSYGGSYTYSMNGFRDTVGTFPAGEKGISYEQTYSVPYIGVGFEAVLPSITFAGRFIASTFVELEAVDNHYQRNLEYTDDFEDGSMFGIDLAASYRFTDHMSIMGAFRYQNYDEVKGSTTVRNTVTGAARHYGGDVAGADNSITMITASLVYEM